MPHFRGGRPLVLWCRSAADVRTSDAGAGNASFDSLALPWFRTTASAGVAHSWSTPSASDRRPALSNRLLHRDRRCLADSAWIACRARLNETLEQSVVPVMCGTGRAFLHVPWTSGVRPPNTVMLSRSTYGELLPVEWDVGAPQRLGLRGVWVDREGTGLAADSLVRPHRIIREFPELLEPAPSP